VAHALEESRIPDCGALENLKKRLDWTDLRIYDINVEGMRHGILLGLNRCTPGRV
jgi:hypothetical protein